MRQDRAAPTTLAALHRTTLFRFPAVTDTLWVASHGFDTREGVRKVRNYHIGEGESCGA